MSADLEKDFDAVAVQINAKLKEAAEAIQEANHLAGTVGLPCLIYTEYIQDDLIYRGMDRKEADAKAEELKAQLEKIDVHALEHALGDGGWSISSSYC